MKRVPVKVITPSRIGQNYRKSTRFPKDQFDLLAFIEAIYEICMDAINGEEGRDFRESFLNEWSQNKIQIYNSMHVISLQKKI